jgi:hypothetical protein
MRAALVVAALAGSATAAAAQRAQASEPAFSVERFTPAPGSALWIGVEDADVPAAGRWVVTGSTWIASRPIVLRALSTGAESTEPVRLRWGQEVAVARGLGARYLVGLAVPAALQWGDRLAGIGLSEAPLARAVLGDLRLHGRARVVGAPGAPGLAAAVAVALTVPTGDDGDFAGEAGAVLAWGLRAGYRTGDVAITGGAGLRLRTEEVVLLSPARPHGNELTASLGAAVRLAPLGRQFGGGDRAWAMVEVEAALGDDAGKGARGPSPAEARIGVRADVAHCWSVALAGGGGFTRDEVGSPGYRRSRSSRSTRIRSTIATATACATARTRAGPSARIATATTTGTAVRSSTTTATASRTASIAARGSPRIATATATPTAAPTPRPSRPIAAIEHQAARYEFGRWPTGMVTAIVSSPSGANTVST